MEEELSYGWMELIDLVMVVVGVIVFAVKVIPPPASPACSWHNATIVRLSIIPQYRNSSFGVTALDEANHQVYDALPSVEAQFWGLLNVGNRVRVQESGIQINSILFEGQKDNEGLC